MIASHITIQYGVMIMQANVNDNLVLTFVDGRYGSTNKFVVESSVTKLVDD